ncbi:MAG: cysteine desulfurase [Clostridiales bacterium]|nr:cysteine desulfurase [Clostridiales bacterium]
MNETRVYLDNAATTKVRPEVFDTMRLVLCEEYGNPSSIHREGQCARKLLEEARESIAQNLACTPEEVFFTSGGTESDNWAIKCAATVSDANKRHIITSAIEHPAVLKPCLALEREGYKVTVLPVDKEGLVSPDSLAKALTPDTALVSVMLGNNEIGTIEPIAELCKLVHSQGALFHTDAVQAVGTIPVDITALGVDLLSFSAHKFYGPKGVGGLYVRKGTLLPSFIDGGAQESNHRAGTENLPGIVGMARALELAVSGLSETDASIRTLREILIREVLDLTPQARFNGHRTQCLPGIANFTFPGEDGERLLLMLNYEGFACSGGAACSSRNAEVSHVLTSIGLSKEEAKSSLRVSIGAFNSEEEIYRFVSALEKLLTKLRRG